MKPTRLGPERFKPLMKLMDAYKEAIGEPALDGPARSRLQAAIEEGRISFYGVLDGDTFTAMCSVSTFFSTFKCVPVGVFEDFYIDPAYRGGGVARMLALHVQADMERSGVVALWVGCSEPDKDMYEHLGFDLELGRLLVWTASGS